MCHDRLRLLSLPCRTSVGSGACHLNCNRTKENSNTQSNVIKTLKEYRDWNEIKNNGLVESRVPRYYDREMFDLTPKIKANRVRHYFKATRDMWYDLLGPEYTQEFLNSRLMWKDERCCYNMVCLWCMSPFIHLYTSYVQILDRNYAEISPHTTGEAASSDEYCSYLCERRIRLISTNGLSNKHTNRSRKVEMLREFRMRFMLLNNVQSLDQVGNRWSSLWRTYSLHHCCRIN